MCIRDSINGVNVTWVNPPTKRVRLDSNSNARGAGVGDADRDAVVGGDGRASDGTTKTADYDGGPKVTVERHADGSTTETTHRNDGRGNRGFEMTDRDASGRVTGRYSYAESPNGDTQTTVSEVNPTLYM